MKTYRIKPIKPRVAKLVKSIKKPLIKSLSLGIVILGIGCISLALFQMMAQSDRVLEVIDRKVTTQPSFAEEGDKLGTISLPSLNREIDIYQGTGTDELNKGVGHFAQSVLPGVKDNCVLSGHNDSVFAQLDSLEIGDLIMVKTVEEEFTYQITGIRIVDKDDRTVIVPTEEAVLTLTTCYPFVVVGAAPERYIVSAELIKQ